MRLRRLSALAATFWMVAFASFAQPPPGNRPPAGRGGMIVFALADRDRDGRVTLDEAWDFIAAGFAAADADRDGALSLEEVADFRPDSPPAAEPGRDRPRRRASEPWREPVFRGLDANRDRRLQLDELRPLFEAMFRAGDLNGDAVISRDEIPGGR